ncbi:MAG: GTPase ObgE [Campylobacterales bacterium]
MFIDRVTITVESGKGGDGAVHFHREKFVQKGGPSGGDGGHGGSVWFVADNNTDTLSHFKGKKLFKAEDGEMGKPEGAHGRNGADLILKVPPGTQIFNAESGELLADLVEAGDRVMLLKGGNGGWGNIHFKSPMNQAPEYAKPGQPSERLIVRLELKLIADVGLVGFPNVGKSTLISVVSHAKPEIANYEFTTLTPKLGVVDVDEMRQFVMADIPGIIEGASDGRGLGLEFLRHIERTKILLFMLDMANYRDLMVQYRTLREELARYSTELQHRPFAIALTKAEQFDADEIRLVVEGFLDELGLEDNLERASNNFGFDLRLGGYVADEPRVGEPLFVVPISSLSKMNIRPLVFALWKAILWVKGES